MGRTFLEPDEIRHKTEHSFLYLAHVFKVERTFGERLEGIMVDSSFEDGERQVRARRGDGVLDG